MNGWFPKIRADGTIASGDTSVWITPPTGAPFIAAEVGGGPVWAGSVLVFNTRQHTTNVGGVIVAGDYNERQGAETEGWWAGATNASQGLVEIWQHTTLRQRLPTACAPRLGGDRVGYMVPFQPRAGGLRDLVIDGVIAHTDILITWAWARDGSVYVYTVGDGSVYGKIIKDHTGTAISLRPDEVSLGVFLGPDDQPWMLSGTTVGLFVRPLYDPMGYLLDGVDIPDCRMLGGRLRVVGSVQGQPKFDQWVDFSQPRRDLREVETVPPVEPPTTPPEPPEPVPVPPEPPKPIPPHPPEPYYRAKAYEVK